MAFAGDPTCTTPIDQAFRFLTAQQDPKGWLGPSCDKRILVQALGTSALAALAPARPQARPFLEKAAAVLLQARGPEGWTRDGSPGVHVVATAWAVHALRQAQVAGVRLPEGWEARSSAGCWRLFDRRKGTVGLARSGEQGGWPAAAAAGWVLSACGRGQDVRVLAPSCRQGALAGLAVDQEPDLEALALLALWMREDAKAFPGGREALRAALLRVARPGARGSFSWETARPNPWDGLEGKAYATAAGAWLLRLLETK